MFNTLRQGSIIYILDKRNKPVLTVGRVSAVSNPVPKYSTSASPLNPLFSNMETTVDITVSVDGQTMEFKKVPSNLSIYGENNVVISESKDAMIAEVEVLRDTSRKIIESVEYNKDVVKQCEEILGQLNPSIVQDKERENRIAGLENEVKDLKTMIAEMSQNIKSLSSN